MGFGFDFKPDDIINRHVRVNKQGKITRKTEVFDLGDGHKAAIVGDDVLNGDFSALQEDDNCGEHHDAERAMWVSDQMPYAIISPAVNVQSPEVRFVIGSLTQLGAVKELHKQGHFNDEERNDIAKALRLMRKAHNAAAMRKIEATGGAVEGLKEEDDENG